MNQETYEIPEAVKNDTYIGVQFNLAVNTVLKDLTGAAIKMELKVNTNESTLPSLTLELGSGLTITDAVNGQFEINEQVISIDAACYYYDIEITFADTTVKTYIKGRWNIIQDITT